MALRTITVAEFKTALQLDEIQVLKNPKTDKFFLATRKGNFRCHQGTDWAKKPKAQILVEDDDMDTACLIPMGLGAQTVASY